MRLFKQRSHEFLVSAKEFMDFAETTREKDMDDLATTVQNMLGNALSKLEESLYDTNTNRCQLMEPVYTMFERRVLESLINVSLPKPVRDFDFSLAVSNV